MSQDHWEEFLLVEFNSNASRRDLFGLGQFAFM